MPFATRRHADPKVVTKYQMAHKRRLRQILSTPGLPAEQREAIKQEIAQVGQTKAYDAQTRRPKPGAIKLEPLPVQVADIQKSSPRRRIPTDASGLSALTKPTLMAISKRFGVPSTGNKADLVQGILAKQRRIS